MKQMLQEFGLTNTEAKVYLTLLSLGCVSASEVIKKAQLHRTTVYDVLERLIEKGFVSFIEKNDKKYFESSSPKKLLDKIKEEELDLSKKEKLAKKLVLDCEKLIETAKEKSNVKVYSGKEGLKTVLDDIIIEGKNFASFGGELRFKDILPVYTDIWAEKRRKKRINARLIGSVGKAPQWDLNECRSVPKEYFSPANTLIYGSKVLIILAAEPILIIQIENNKIAQGYLNYFNLLWTIARKS